MLPGRLLLTWILMATITTVQCQGITCHPTRTSAVAAGPHRLTIFPTPEACESVRLKLEQMHTPVVRTLPHSTVSVRKEYTFTCHAGG